jgi:RNA polymerase sigma-70 factor (ECF subfamily)
MSDAKPETTTSAARLAGSAFQAHAAAIYRFMRRRIARPQDADDLAHEVFIRFLRIDDAKLVSKPLAYLYGIAAHVVHEFRMQSEQEHEHVVYDSLMVESVAEMPAQPDPDELADCLALQQQLERLLNKLPRAHRAVLLMVKRDGLSHREVARITRIHVRTVERYVMQAMTRLRTMEWNRP